MYSPRSGGILVETKNNSQSDLVKAEVGLDGLEGGALPRRALFEPARYIAGENEPTANSRTAITEGQPNVAKSLYPDWTPGRDRCSAA